jgi:hypothetical protein
MNLAKNLDKQIESLNLKAEQGRRYHIYFLAKELGEEAEMKDEMKDNPSSELPGKQKAGEKQIKPKKPLQNEYYSP